MILYILYKEKLNPTVESFLSYFLTIYGPFWTFYNQLSIWFPLNNNNNPLEEELRRSSKELLKLAPPHHLWYVAKEDGIDKKCKSSMLCVVVFQQLLETLGQKKSNSTCSSE